MIDFTYPELPVELVELAPPASWQPHREEWSSKFGPGYASESTEPSYGYGRRYDPIPEPSGPVRRLLFGGPLAVPLGEADVSGDPALATFMKAETKTSRYLLVHSSLSFQSDPGDPRLETAAVQITLDDETGTGAPVAWSLLPASASTPVNISTGFSLGPSVKLHGATVDLGRIHKGIERLGKDVFLLATGELTNTPEWAFCRTASVELKGTHRLVMVVRAPLGRRATMDVALSASMKTGRLSKKTIEVHGRAGPATEL